MSSTDYRLTSNVSRAKSFNFGCVIRSTRQCSSNRLSEMSGPYESAITIALLRRNTAISSSGFGSARAKNTTISSENCVPGADSTIAELAAGGAGTGRAGTGQS
jgi:hypothetical protein